MKTAWLPRLLRALSTYLGCHVYIVRVRAFDHGSTDEDAPPSHIQISELSADQVAEAANDPELGISRAVVEQVHRGDRMFGAYADHQLVAYTTRSTTSAPHHGLLTVKVDHPYVYAYAALTRESHRGLRINGALVEAAAQAYAALGYTHQASFVMPANSAVRAREWANGYRNIGYAGYAGWFGRTFTFASRGAKSIGFRFRSGPH